MPKRQNPHYKRSSRMDRTMTPADLHLLNYAVLLKQVCHEWSWDFIDTLSPAAAKVLRMHLSAALVGKRGYAGLHIPGDLLCAKIREITGQKCQNSTLRNGRRELEAKGLITRSKAPSANARAIHLEGDRYTQPQWCVSMLTPKCVAMFDKTTHHASDETLKLFSERIKSNASSQIKDPLPPETGGEGDLKANTKDEVTKQHHSSPSPSPDSQGKPTWPSSSASSSTGEQHSLTPDATSQGGQAEPTPLSWEALNKASRFRRGASWRGPRGCSAERPKIPRGRKRKGRTFARAKIFNALHQELWNYPRPQADDIFCRAKVEFQLAGFSSFTSVCDLPYWLSQAHKLTVQELRGHMRGRIIPALKYSGPMVPKGRRPIGKPTKPARKAVKTAVPAVQLPGFLRKFSKSVGLEQD